MTGLQWAQDEWSWLALTATFVVAICGALRIYSSLLGLLDVERRDGKAQYKTLRLPSLLLAAFGQSHNRSCSLDTPSLDARQGVTEGRLKDCSRTSAHAGVQSHVKTCSNGTAVAASASGESASDDFELKCRPLRTPSSPSSRKSLRSHVAVALEAALAPLADEVPVPRPLASNRGLPVPVYLHVYDVSHDAGIQRLNHVLAHHLAPLKFGGLFHVGVEVNAQEWSFGYCAHGSGVCAHRPRQHPNHNYRETLPLQSTQFSHEEVAQILASLAKVWPGREYHLMRRNCCHFAAELCGFLGVGPIPSYVLRLASIGDSALTALPNRSVLFEGADRAFREAAALSRCCGEAIDATRPEPGSEQAEATMLDEVSQTASIAAPITSGGILESFFAQFQSSQANGTALNPQWLSM